LHDGQQKKVRNPQDDFHVKSGFYRVKNFPDQMLGVGEENKKIVSDLRKILLLTII